MEDLLRFLPVGQAYSLRERHVSANGTAAHFPLMTCGRRHHFTRV